MVYFINLVDANEKLINYMFPWADGIITKPSGDMAYDAAASGAFCLFLEPLGPWEQNIQDRFLDLNIAADLKTSDIRKELSTFSKTYWQGQSWFTTARQNLKTLPNLYLSGAANIIRTYKDSP